jgi:hypothetical protein
VRAALARSNSKHNDCPQLAKARPECRLRNATLVIAKLDRLSRNAAFLLNLKEAGVDFICSDMPDANKLTIGIMALIAQNEREAISARTKARWQRARRVACHSATGQPDTGSSHARLSRWQRHQGREGEQACRRPGAGDCRHSGHGFDHLRRHRR